MRTTVFGLLLLSSVACSPTQRATVGTTVGGAGALTTFVALESMVPSCRAHTEPHDTRVAYSKATPPNVGFPLAFAGLGAVVLGGLLIATASEYHQQPQTDAPAPPTPITSPTRLDQREAVGMAIAHVLLAKRVDGNSKPTRLLGVDESHSQLHVAGRYAELRNLRVHTAADETWLTLDACFEYQPEHAWWLTSLGTTPGCPR
jgi:hypothetical protein